MLCGQQNSRMHFEKRPNPARHSVIKFQLKLGLSAQFSVPLACDIELFSFVLHMYLPR